MNSPANFSNQHTLLEEIKRGNHAAFEYLFKRYYRRLYGYAARFIDDPDTVEDILQESFMKIWEKKDALKALSVSSLLFAVVRNGCLDYLKHSAIVKQHRIEYSVKAEGEEKLYHADFTFEAEYGTLCEELEEQIRLVIDGLPARCKEVFLLSRFEGLTYKEIAGKLQISVKAVENHISKALSIFTVHFKNKYPLHIYIILISWLIDG
ncbi:MAG: RNA polymerase sigma-70 factor [Candidatus Symbiothrix sp.]|jgi:RNA polymerase sigma-70 factor (ECF subfamily)|nr:RNA polymerase sigma-70 factor [Candidatus Symbiothrix sp.]